MNLKKKQHTPQTTTINKPIKQGSTKTNKNKKVWHVINAEYILTGKKLFFPQPTSPASGSLFNLSGDPWYKYYTSLNMKMHVLSSPAQLYADSWRFYAAIVPDITVTSLSSVH